MNREMDGKNEIGKLLEKYYAGETAEYEEKILKDWSESPGGLGDPEGEMFRELSSLSSEAEPPAGFERELENVIDIAYSSGHGHMRLIASFVSVAVAAAIAAVAFLMPVRTVTPADTFEDPASAYAEAVRALELVSKNMNKGLVRAERDIGRAGTFAAGTLDSAMPDIIQEKENDNN